jgi:hypothetical protein
MKRLVSFKAGVMCIHLSRVPDFYCFRTMIADSAYFKLRSFVYINTEDMAVYSNVPHGNSYRPSLLVNFVVG